LMRRQHLAYAAVATGPGLVTDEEHYRIDAAVVRAAGDVSWMLRSLGTVARASLALAAALAVRRARRRRLGELGIVLAALTFGFALQEGHSTAALRSRSASRT
jgi:hypothetical protein